MTLASRASIKIHIREKNFEEISGKTESLTFSFDSRVIRVDHAQNVARDRTLVLVYNVSFVLFLS